MLLIWAVGQNTHMVVNAEVCSSGSPSRKNANNLVGLWCARFTWGFVQSEETEITEA